MHVVQVASELPWVWETEVIHYHRAEKGLQLPQGVNFMSTTVWYISEHKIPQRQREEYIRGLAVLSSGGNIYHCRQSLKYGPLGITRIYLVIGRRDSGDIHRYAQRLPESQADLLLLITQLSYHMTPLSASRSPTGPRRLSPAEFLKA